MSPQPEETGGHRRTLNSSSCSKTTLRQSKLCDMVSTPAGSSTVYTVVTTGTAEPTSMQSYNCALSLKTSDMDHKLQSRPKCNSARKNDHQTSEQTVLGGLCRLPPEGEDSDDDEDIMRQECYKEHVSPAQRPVRSSVLPQGHSLCSRNTFPNTYCTH